MVVNYMDRKKCFNIYFYTYSDCKDCPKDKSCRMQWETYGKDKSRDVMDLSPEQRKHLKSILRKEVRKSDKRKCSECGAWLWSEYSPHNEGCSFHYKDEKCRGCKFDIDEYYCSNPEVCKNYDQFTEISQEAEEKILE